MRSCNIRGDEGALSGRPRIYLVRNAPQLGLHSWFKHRGEQGVEYWLVARVGACSLRFHKSQKSHQQGNEPITRGGVLETWLRVSEL